MLRRRKDGTARRGTPSEWVIVGLANPGIEFRGTRHNLGEAIVEEFAARHGSALRVEPRLRARIAELSVEDHRVLLAVPTTYMNESAAAVVPLLRRGGIEDVARLLVVHDELDFAPGRLQLKVGGGLAGHNGLRSISGALGTEGFARLRVGIGKPASKDHGADWVLSRPGRAERDALDHAVLDGADAIELLVTAGMDAAIAGLVDRG